MHQDHNSQVFPQAIRTQQASVQVNITEAQFQNGGITVSPTTLTHIQLLKYLDCNSLKKVNIHGQYIVVQTDTEFVGCIMEICQSSETLMDTFNATPITELQFQQINYQANLHCRANSINLNSAKSIKNIKQDPSLQNLLCGCGCNRFQGQKFSLCYDLQQINILGSGVLLFFLQMKVFALNILLFVLIYAIFAMTTNLEGTLYREDNPSDCTDEYCYFHDQISHYNKQAPYFSHVQRWLGFVGTIFYIFICRLVKLYGQQKDKLIDYYLTSASDFSIKINNLPEGDYDEPELLDYLTNIWTKSSPVEQPSEQKVAGQSNFQNLATKKPMSLQNLSKQSNKGDINVSQTKITQRDLLGIKSVQIIYNMQFSRNMIQQINDRAITINSKIKRQDDLLIIEDAQQYRQLKGDFISTYQTMIDLRKRFLNDCAFRRSITTRTALIQFESENCKDIALAKYIEHKLTVLKWIKGLCSGKQQQTLLYFKGNLPQIGRAPEPSDILWLNCQKNKSVFRSLIIFFTTLAIILVSLVIVAALQLSQNNQSSSSSSTGLSILTSVVLQIINKLLWLSLFYLLQLEHNHTKTLKIVSQMNKSSIAMLVNIIFLPILVTYIYNNQYFGGKGLAGIVFDYHISALVISLVIKLFDPVTLLLNIGIAIHCIRDYLIRTRYHKKEGDKTIDQYLMKNVYTLYQGPDFQIAESYVFVISNVAHAFFFAELQPFILVLVFFQCLFFYWVCKIQILKICKIPQLTEKLIFEAACSQIMLVPVCYGIGSIFNSYVTSKQNSAQNFQWVASALCIAISLLNYFNPGSIFNHLQKIPKFCLSNYEQKQEDNDNSQIRLQDYYKESNSLSLLSFENILRGKINNPAIEKELKDYCQSHLSSYSFSLNSKEQESPSSRSKIQDAQQKYRSFTESTNKP